MYEGFKNFLKKVLDYIKNKIYIEKEKYVIIHQTG